MSPSTGSGQPVPQVEGGGPEDLEVPPPSGRREVLRAAMRIGGFVASALGLGALAGVAWWRLVDLPGYRINSERQAYTTERSLADFLATDAWFCVLGLGVGLVLGVVGWRVLRRLGWPMVLLVAGAALGAGLTCWLVGYGFGPRHFPERLVAAQPGAFVPIDLTLRARASLLVWPFFAVVPVLLASSLGRDEEDVAAEPQRAALDG